MKCNGLSVKGGMGNRGTGNRGIGESGNRGICKRGNMETASVIVFKLFLNEAAANSVYHIKRSFCFH